MSTPMSTCVPYMLQLYMCMYIQYMRMSIHMYVYCTYVHTLRVCAYIVLHMCTYSTCAFLHTLCMHMYMVYILYTDMNPQN